MRRLPKPKKATPGVVAMHIAAAAKPALAKPVPQVKPAPAKPAPAKAKAKAKAKNTTRLQQYLSGAGGRGGSSSKSAAKSSSKSAANRPSLRPQHDLRGPYGDLLDANKRAAAVEKSITL